MHARSITCVAPDALRGLPALTSLDLSRNMIVDVRGLAAVAGSLTHLDVSYNRLDEGAIVHLGALTALRSLVLRGNPAAGAGALASLLPSLEVLDGARVADGRTPPARARGVLPNSGGEATAAGAPGGARHGAETAPLVSPTSTVVAAASARGHATGPYVALASPYLAVAGAGAPALPSSRHAAPSTAQVALWHAAPGAGVAGPALAAADAAGTPPQVTVAHRQRGGGASPASGARGGAGGSPWSAVAAAGAMGVTGVPEPELAPTQSWTAAAAALPVVPPPQLPAGGNGGGGAEAAAEQVAALDARTRALADLVSVYESEAALAHTAASHAGAGRDMSEARARVYTRALARWRARVFELMLQAAATEHEATVSGARAVAAARAAAVALSDARRSADIAEKRAAAAEAEARALRAAAAAHAATATAARDDAARARAAATAADARPVWHGARIVFVRLGGVLFCPPTRSVSRYRGCVGPGYSLAVP